MRAEQAGDPFPALVLNDGFNTTLLAHLVIEYIQVELLSRNYWVPGHPA